MMAVLTDDAQRHLDRYLRQVKAAMRGNPAVDVADVERDVIGHIDAALTGEAEPVDADRLLPVLDRLGAPSTWITDEEQVGRRKALDGLRARPDWWLAWFSIVLFLAGPILFLAGPFFWPLEPVMVLGSVLLARAALALLAEHDEPVGARRWLLYPPLITSYAVVVAVTVAWPGVVAVLASNDVPRVREFLTELTADPSLGAVSLAAAVTGLWWATLGVVLFVWPAVFRVAFYPFAERFERRHAVRVVLVGVLIAGMAGVFLATIGNR